jgi:hypothetical protein
VPTRGERRPSRSDLRERQCGDAGRSGANEAGEGAVRLSVCSAAEMRWCSGADRHKEDQGGVGEASYQTVAGGGHGGEGGGRGERRAVGWLALGGWDWDWERRVRERERLRLSRVKVLVLVGIRKRSAARGEGQSGTVNQ